MTTVKQEQWELEQRIHALSGEAGAAAIREYVHCTLGAINAAWPNLTGEDLIRAQGQAKSLGVLLRIIDNGPKHKPALPALKTYPEA